MEVLVNRKQEVWHECGSTRGAAAVRARSDDDDSHVDGRIRQTN